MSIFRGILHRDIKPSNVLVVNGEVKLLDFGIAARVSTDFEFAGTLEYIAPELLLWQPASTASDLYSVGVILYQVLAGQFPFSRDSMTRMLEGILGKDASQQTIPPNVAEMLKNYRPSEQFNSQPDTDRQDLNAEAPENTEAELALPEDVPLPVVDLVRKLLKRRAEERYQNANTALRALASVVPFPLQVETAATRESLLQATELLGREEEISKLTALMKRAQGGQGASVLVGGESGVGKSRLLFELRTQALVSGLWVVEGQSVSEGGGYYHELLPLFRMLCVRTDILDVEAAVLKPLMPEISSLLEHPVADPPPTSPQETQARLIATLLGLIGKVKKPLLIILEDLHWARGETLALLAAVTPKLTHLPVLLVGTFRSEEKPALPAQLPAAELLPLGRFGKNDIGRLSTSMLGAVGATPALVSYLGQQTEGNVFFLIEIVRALAENAGELGRIQDGELPESVLTLGIERMVERRIDRVRPAFGDLLDFAATNGRKLDLLVLERAFPSADLRTFLFECANAAVLESQGTEWRFAHDKLRETLLRRLDGNTRKTLHHKVGDAIEAAYIGVDRDRMSVALGHHFQQAGVFDKALEYYLRAGDGAAKLFLYEEARVHYGTALTTLEQLPETPVRQRQHVDILLKQVMVGLYSDATELRSRRLSKARLLLDGLTQAGKTVPEDRLRQARVDYYTGRGLHLSSQPQEAIQHFLRVLPVAKEFADEELMIVPAAAIGQAQLAQGHFGKARELLEPTIEPMIRQFGLSVESLRCISYYNTVLAGVGQCQRAIAGMDRLRKWMKEEEKNFFEGLFLTIHSIGFFFSGDCPTILRVADELCEIASRTNELMYLYIALDVMAWAQSHMGRHLEAFENRARALEVRRSKGGGIAADWFEAVEAEMLLNGGRTEEALRKAEKVAVSSGNAGLRFSLAIAERAWGSALSRLGGGFSEVEVHFKESLEICQSAEQVMNAGQTELWWGRICKERGDLAASGLHFARALAIFEAAGADYALAEAKRIIEEDAPVR